MSSEEGRLAGYKGVEDHSQGPAVSFAEVDGIDCLLGASSLSLFLETVGFFF